MVPQITQGAGDRAEACRRRAETSVRRASHMSADQLWKSARLLHAVSALAHTQEQRAALEARAERVGTGVGQGAPPPRRARRLTINAHPPARCS
jgi:hypothetical protein